MVCQETRQAGKLISLYKETQSHQWCPSPSRKRTVSFPLRTSSSRLASARSKGCSGNSFPILASGFGAASLCKCFSRSAFFRASYSSRFNVSPNPRWPSSTKLRASSSSCHCNQVYQQKLSPKIASRTATAQCQCCKRLESCRDRGRTSK